LFLGESKELHPGLVTIEKLIKPVSFSKGGENLIPKPKPNTRRGLLPPASGRFNQFRGNFRGGKGRVGRGDYNPPPFRRFSREPPAPSSPIMIPSTPPSKIMGSGGSSSSVQSKPSGSNKRQHFAETSCSLAKKFKWDDFLVIELYFGILGDHSSPKELLKLTVLFCIFYIPVGL
jgi:hypothetical protein